jgi:hypothetical protein
MARPQCDTPLVSPLLEGVLKKGISHGYYGKKRTKWHMVLLIIRPLTMGLIPIQAHAHQHQTSCPFWANYIRVCVCEVECEFSPTFWIN